MAKTRAPEPEETEDERDYTAYAEKDISGKADAFVDWISEEVGYDADPRSVMLAVNLHSDFQGSDFWREDERNPRSEAGKQARATSNGAETETSAPAPAKGRRGKAKAAETEAPAKPARRGRAAAAKPAAAAAKPAAAADKPAPRSGRRGAKPAASSDETAPY